MPDGDAKAGPDGFREAPAEIEQAVGRLLTMHFPELADARILLLIRDSAQASENGQFSVAAAGAPSTAAEREQFDYVLWFAWDVWQVLDDGDRDALVFHELMHLGVDEDGSPQLVPHDAGVFNRELELYGLWWVDAQMKFREIQREN